MKTLWDKINRTTKERIEKDSTEFPYLVDSLKKELQSNYFVSDLKFGHVTRVFTYAYDVYEPFNELKLRNLFENETE